MFKKILSAIIIILFISFAAFHGYKLKIYKEFKKYLNENYIDKSFHLHWVSYDFLYHRFSAKVHCNNDGTDFVIDGGGDNISEQYLILRNMKTINKTIKSYLQNEDFFIHVQDVSVGVEDIQALDTRNEIAYNKLAYTISIMYEYNSIKDHGQFAKTSYEIIKVLKRNGVNLNSITFDYEIDKKVFKLLLQGEDINKQPEEISRIIRTRK